MTDLAVDRSRFEELKRLYGEQPHEQVMQSHLSEDRLWYECIRNLIIAFNVVTNVKNGTENVDYTEEYFQCFEHGARSSLN